MTVSVIERLLYRILPAVGLIPEESMTARWEADETATATLRSMH